MPQEKPKGTARRRSAGMADRAGEETGLIRHQQSVNDRLPPVRRPDPPTEDSFNRPYTPDERGGERQPFMDPSWSRGDSVSAYQGMYKTSRAAAELLYSKAREHELDPAVGFGLVEQESRFRQDARSGAGAVGIAQVIPEQAGRGHGVRPRGARE